MKASLRFILAAGLCAVLTLACVEYDDAELRDKISSLEGRVSTLEDLVKTANKNIQSLQTLTAGLDKAVFVTAVNELSDGGYEIKFSNNKTATIKDGKDGEDGEDGSTPAIGVKQDTNGIYYWTIDGEWLLDADGNKLRVTGEKGDPGDPGQDGVTPLLKIEGGFWYVSVDKGEIWTVLGSATGESSDSLFKGVTWDDNYVYVTLQDDTVLELSRGANGVQAVAVVPDLEDGGVLSVLNEFTLRFDVLPASSAAAITSLDPSLFRVNLVYTQTKAQAGDELSLPITQITGSDGRINVTVDGSSLCEDFAIGKLGASASLSIDDGNHAVTSGYFPVRYDTERIRKLVEKQWLYPDVVPHLVRDIGYSFPGYYFYTNESAIYAGINPTNALKGPYYIYQLPNGIIKLFSDKYPYWYVFRVVSETEIEQRVYAQEYEEPYNQQDEYGWHSGKWNRLTLIDTPRKLLWKTMAVCVNGVNVALTESSDSQGVPTFEYYLQGMEQTLPMVRMNDSGTASSFALWDVVGKIVVLDRGEISFSEKLNNAYEAGAIGVLCVNNSPDSPPAPGLSSVNPAVDIPFAMISQRAGQMLDGHRSITFVSCTDPTMVEN